MEKFIKLDELLESKYTGFETKLYYLQSLFQVALFWSFSQENKDFLEANRDLDEVDFYVDQLEYSISEYLSKWKNLNTVNDFIKLKELLKESYFDDTLKPEIKRSIINSISAFPTIEDLNFYHKIVCETFIYEDKDIGMNLLKNCYDVIKFLEHNKFNLSILYINDEKSKLFYGNMCIANCNYSYLTYFRAIAFFKNKNTDFKFFGKHYSKHSIETVENENSEAILNYSLFDGLDTSKIKVSLTIDNKVVLNILELYINEFLKDFKDFTDNYFNKKQNFSLYLNEQNKVFLETKWNVKYNRYFTDIIFEDKIICKVDTRDLIFIFSSMLSHLTLVFELKYSLCLQKQTNISNKDYIKLISLFERAI